MALETKFVTFYSYKGGVGRTSALVNTALLRAKQGDQVLLIDFDLEAPGVGSYLKSVVKNKFDQPPKGILEYLHRAISDETVPSIRDYAIDCEIEGIDEGKLWVIFAGQVFKREYSSKLDTIKWSEVFEQKHGSLLIKNMKEQIRQEFNQPDYVFIDSRTGITEAGGICTKLLADTVVVMASLNDQNILGSSAIYNSFQKENINTLVVASNVPVGMPVNGLFASRMDQFKTVFDRNPDHLIYHYPALSLSEFLPAAMDTNDANYLASDPLYDSYMKLANDIDSNNQSSYSNYLRKIQLRLLRVLQSDRYLENFENEIKKIKSNFPNRAGMIEMLDAMRDWYEKIKNENFGDLSNSDYGHLQKLKNQYKTEKSKTEIGTHLVDTLCSAVLSAKIFKHLDDEKNLKKLGNLMKFIDDYQLANFVYDRLRSGKEKGLSDAIKGVDAEDLGIANDLDSQYLIGLCHFRNNEKDDARKLFKGVIRVYGESYSKSKTPRIILSFLVASRFSPVRGELIKDAIDRLREVAQLSPNETTLSPATFEEFEFQNFEAESKKLLEEDVDVLLNNNLTQKPKD